MIKINGTKNFTIRRGDTFEFAFTCNFINLISKAVLVCKTLNIAKEFRLYEGVYYFRMEPSETHALPEDIHACRYMVTLYLTSGAVTTLFIDGVLEITEGGNVPEPPEVNNVPDPLAEVDDFTVAPSFRVDLFDWLRVQVPQINRLVELPEPSPETMDTLYLRTTDDTIWYTIQTNVNGSDVFEWRQVIDSSTLETILSSFNFLEIINDESPTPDPTDITKLYRTSYDADHHDVSNLQENNYTVIPEVNETAHVVCTTHNVPVTEATFKGYFDNPEAFTGNGCIAPENINTFRVVEYDYSEGTLASFSVALDSESDPEGYVRRQENDFVLFDIHYYGFYCEDEGWFAYVRDLSSLPTIDDILVLDTGDGAEFGCSYQQIRDDGYNDTDIIVKHLSDTHSDAAISNIQFDGDLPEIVTQALRVGTNKNQGTLFIIGSGKSLVLRVGKYFSIDYNTKQRVYDKDATVVLNQQEITFSSDDEILELTRDEGIALLQNGANGRIILYGLSAYAPESGLWERLDLDTIRQREKAVSELNSSLMNDHIEPLETTTSKHNTQIQNLRADVIHLQDDLGATAARIGTIRADNIAQLPEPSHNYLNQVYRVNDEFYYCKIDSGTEINLYDWSFENVAGTSEITADNFVNFANDVGNGFKDLVSVSSLSKVYRNSGSIKLGSSNAVGTFDVDVVLDNITKVEVDWGAWSANKTSTISVEHEYGDTPVTAQATGADGMQTLVIEDLDDYNPEFVISSANDQDKRIIVYGFRFYTGSGAVYGWHKIGGGTQLYRHKISIVKNAMGEEERLDNYFIVINNDPTPYEWTFNDQTQQGFTKIVNMDNVTRACAYDSTDEEYATAIITDLGVKYWYDGNFNLIIQTLDTDSWSIFTNEPDDRYYYDSCLVDEVTPL